MKFRQYCQIAAFKEYILVAQDRPSVERYVRQSDQTWVLTMYDALSRSLEFATIAATIPLAEIYRGVSFPENLRGELA